MIPHFARFLRNEGRQWLGDRNDAYPIVSDLERMPGTDPGTIPNAVRFKFEWIDYLTGRQHRVTVIVTELVVEDDGA